jgi:hypothetical protein
MKIPSKVPTSQKSFLNSYVNSTIISIFTPLIIYMCFSYGYFGKGHSWTSEYLGDATDPIAYIWFIHWWSFAIAHHIGPFITTYVWFPGGDNLTWKASVPFAALMALPFTIFGGPVLSFNMLTLSAPAFAAWTAFLLARHLTRDWAASLIGGYLFGFSSYELGQLFGHLNLDMIFLVPVAVLLCVRRAQGQMGRWMFIVLLAMVFLAQLGLSTEILATLCLFGAVTWALFLLNAPRADRAGLWPLAIEIPAAAILMVLLALPFEIDMIKGFSDFTSVPAPEIAEYSSDLLGFITPTAITRLGRSVYGPEALLFNQNYSETGIYLGLPLIFLLTSYFVTKIEQPYVRALLATACVLVLFSLGPWLHVGGIQLALPMPWHLALRLPLIKSVMPERFSMYVALSTGIAAALWVATPAAWPKRGLKLTWAGIACVFVAPNLSIHRWTPWPVDPFFTPVHVRAALGKAPNVLILPFGPSGPDMAWQVDAGFGFTQSGGYTGAPPLSEDVWPLLYDFETDTVPPQFANDLAAFCATHHVDFILEGPGTPATIATAIGEQGWPQRRDGDIGIVQVPSPGRLTYYYVLGDYWPSGSTGWMGRHVTIVNHSAPKTLTLTGDLNIQRAVRVSVDDGSNHAIYSIARGAVQTIAVPADAIVTLTADRTYVADQLVHNGDLRRLSVAIAIESELPR